MKERVAIAKFIYYQVDNQVFGAVRKVLLYTAPSSRLEDAGMCQVIQLTVRRIPESKWNAEIIKVRV